MKCQKISKGSGNVIQTTEDVFVQSGFEFSISLENIYLYFEVESKQQWFLMWRKKTRVAKFIQENK